MPRFRQGGDDRPLLPAQLSSSLGILHTRRRSRSLGAILTQTTLLLLVTVALFVAVSGVLLFILNRHEGGSSTGGHLKGRVILGRHTPPKNEALQQKLNEIIDEATNVAREMEIVTETDAAEEERLLSEQKIEDWSHILHDNHNVIGRELNSSVPTCSTNDDCAPHGVCQKGACRCVAAFAGRYCGHAITISRPFVNHPVDTVWTIGYEGDFIALRGHAATHSLSNRMQLPDRDTVVKGRVHATCAVVGPSGSLLLWQSGEAIDGHDIVIRLGYVPSNSVEKKQLGRQTSVIIVDGGSGRPIQRHAASQGAYILRQGALLPPNEEHGRVFHSSKGFEEHIAPFSSDENDASGVLFSVILALNGCQRVTLYGLSPIHGVAGISGTYSQPCTRPPNILNKDWSTVHGLVLAGLAHFGEPCVIICASTYAEDKGACARCISQNAGSIPVSGCDGDSEPQHS